MNKKTISAFCISGLFALSAPALAEDTHSHGKEEHEHDAKTEKKSGRKKRVLMCKDCGKPESKCDCPEEVKAKERAETAKKEAEEKKQ